MSTLLKVEEEPNYSQIVTEDDTPLDSIYSEIQQWVLVDSLYSSWKPGRPFIALFNVGLFYEFYQPPLVPDMLLSLDVQPAKDIWEKKNRSYFVWVFGKPPDVVVEVVSNKVGGEAEKIQKYEQIGVPYYIIFDPGKFIQKDELRIYELHGTRYLPKIDTLLSKVGLRVTLWDGVLDGMNARWLRWCDPDGNLLSIGREGKEQERQRADQEYYRAEIAELKAEQERHRAEIAEHTLQQERLRAKQERQRAERLAQKLIELGIQPEG